MKEGDDIALCADEHILGVLHLQQKYRYDKQREAERVYLTDETAHPGVAALYAQGEDERVVTPDRPTKSISAENTFRRDTGAYDELAAEAKTLCAQVASGLQRKNFAAGTIVLKLKSSDFKIITRNMRLANPTQRAAVIEAQALALIRREVDGRTFRLIGVGAADLVSASSADPPDLFDP